MVGSVDVYREQPASAVLSGHRKRVFDCAIAPDNRFLVSASADKTARAWDLDTGTCTQTIKLKKWAFRCAVTPDGMIAVASAATIGLYRLGSAEPIRILDGHTKAVTGLVSAPDGSYLVSASADGTLRMWDPGTGETIQLLEGHAKHVASCDVAPDGSYIVSVGQDWKLHIWDPKTGRLQMRDSLPTKGIGGICRVLPGGRIMVSFSTAAGGAGAMVWGPETGKVTKNFGVDGLAATPAGEVLVHGRKAPVVTDHGTVVEPRDSTTVDVCDAATGNLRLRLPDHTKAVMSAAVSVDGAMAVTASLDRTLRVWPIGPVGYLHDLVGAKTTVVCPACRIARGQEVAMVKSTDPTLDFESVGRTWECPECGHSAVDVSD